MEAHQDMNRESEKMLACKIWAVVGANQDPQKYGNMIYRRLKDRGYRVYAVNPNYQTVDGDKCYENLASLPETPEVLDMVVSPKYGIAAIEEAAGLGIKNIWLQPGAYNDELLGIIAKRGLNAVQACVLVALG